MNNISNNVYLVGRVNSMESYTVNQFLHRELAIRRDAELNDVRVAVYNILLSHGFDFFLQGCDYLALLAERYIVKSDYSEASAINDIAVAFGINHDLIIGCIRDSIKLNKKFIPTARRTLSMYIAPNPTITDAVEIVGALFKVYFNYTVYTEHFEEEDIPAINFSKVILKNGND